MNSLKPQAEALRNYWARVYAAVRANPSAYQAYLPGANAEQVNEVVGTVVYWFDRIRPPTGFAPAFHLAKALASAALTTAASSCERLVAGEYGHFPTLLFSLTQVLAALHSLIHFGGRKEAESSVADLGARLAESLNLLETAQRELAAKTTQLSQSDSVMARAEAAADRADAVSVEAGSTLDSLKTLAASASKQSDSIASALDEAEKLRVATKSTSEQSVKLAMELEKLLAEVATVSQKAQDQQALVTALLPKGASAGLANAFAMRVGQLERAKWIWMTAFGVAILALTVVAGWVLYLSGSSGIPLWLQVVQRIPLAAPLVWLGWFSAIQYGNTLRVQEDYAFKEATAKAFAGFKDHLEHMASIAEEEGASAMTLLYRKTMDSLAREPLRVFQGSAQDAAPSQAIADSLKSMAAVIQSGKVGAG